MLDRKLELLEVDANLRDANREFSVLWGHDAQVCDVRAIIQTWQFDDSFSPSEVDFHDLNIFVSNDVVGWLWLDRFHDLVGGGGGEVVHLVGRLHPHNVAILVEKLNPCDTVVSVCR